MIQYAGNVPEGFEDLTLPITVTGPKLVLTAGPFFALDQMFELLENEEFVLTPRNELQYLNASLVRVKADQSVRLLVDEVWSDDPAFEFKADGPYERLRPVFNAVVEANVTSLEEVTITVHRNLKPIPKAPEPIEPAQV